MNQTLSQVSFSQAEVYTNIQKVHTVSCTQNTIMVTHNTKIIQYTTYDVKQNPNVHT